MKSLGTPPEINPAKKSKLAQSITRKATPNDLWKIFDLYKIVSQVNQGNQRAIQFYERHGFVWESIARQKIRRIDENFESEVTLVWFNPNFSLHSLKKYHAFLRHLILASPNGIDRTPN